VFISSVVFKSAGHTPQIRPLDELSTGHRSKMPFPYS
jgi:hypothetical protein